MNRHFRVIVPAFLVGGALGVVVGFGGSALSWFTLGAASLVVIAPLFLSFGIVGATIGAMFFLDDESEDAEHPASSKSRAAVTMTRKPKNSPSRHHGAAA